MGSLPYTWAGFDHQGNLRSGFGTVTTADTALPLMGMATVYADWSARVAETGPVSMRRVYAGSTWNHSSLVSRINACHAGGVVPYASMKNGGTVASWSQMVAGQWDAQIDALAAAIAAGPAPVRLAYHHEPRPATLAELKVWGQAHTRFNLRIKAIAGSKAIVGPCDNGHPWSDQSFAHLSDADLARAADALTQVLVEHERWGGA